MGEPPFAARPCSQRGLPCRLRCRGRGGLLPHLFTLTSQGSRASLTPQIACAICQHPNPYPTPDPRGKPHGTRQIGRKSERAVCFLWRSLSLVTAAKRPLQGPGCYPALRSREPGLSSPLPRGREAAARPAIICRINPRSPPSRTLFLPRPPPHRRNLPRLPRRILRDRRANPILCRRRAARTALRSPDSIERANSTGRR